MPTSFRLILPQIVLPLVILLLVACSPQPTSDPATAAAPPPAAATVPATHADTQARAPESKDQTTPALMVTTFDGKPWSLREQRGHWVLVNFWATWCVPCREEMPALVALQSRFGTKGLQIVGIGIDDAAKMRQFTRSIGLNYPALDGGYGALELSRVVGNAAMALPYTVVIDRGGKVIAQQLGPFTARQLDELATQLL